MTARAMAERFGVSERTVQRIFALPRAEYEASSLTRSKPWEALGMSRATWYRKGKPKINPLVLEKRRLAIVVTPVMTTT